MPRYNKSANPAQAVDATGWLAGGPTGASTARATNLTGMLRPTGQQITNGTTAGDQFIYGGAYQLGTAGALTGQAWSGCIEVRRSTTGSVTFYLAWLNTSGQQLSAVTGATIAATAGNPVSGIVTGTAPASTAGVCMVAAAVSAPASGVFVATATRIEQILDPNIVFADGGSDRWAWDGTAGSSTSTRAADDGDEWWALLSQL